MKTNKGIFVSVAPLVSVEVKENVIKAANRSVFETKDPHTSEIISK